MLELLLPVAFGLLVWAAFYIPGYLFARYVLRIDKNELARDDQGCALAGISIIFWCLVAGAIWLAIVFV